MKKKTIILTQKKYNFVCYCSYIMYKYSIKPTSSIKVYKNSHDWKIFILLFYITWMLFTLKNNIWKILFKYWIT